MSEALSAAGHQVVTSALVTDDIAAVANAILEGVRAGANVILTSGGTGLSPNDVTPEATRRVIDREVPGIAEALRARSLATTAHGMLSRGVAGTVGATLVVNLPGSPRAVRESLEVLLPVLDRTMSAKDSEHELGRHEGGAHGQPALIHRLLWPDANPHITRARVDTITPFHTPVELQVGCVAKRHGAKKEASL